MSVESNMYQFFRVNGTHFFLAGGFSPAYKSKDIFADKLSSQDRFVEEEPQPAKTLDSAWIFDGHSWMGIAKMNQARQNFACSLAFNLTKVLFLQAELGHMAYNS